MQRNKKDNVTYAFLSPSLSLSLPFTYRAPADDDFIGGSIAPALHYPSGQFESSLPKLLADETIRSKDQVVFHCMLSQQRGPSCAKMYAYAKRAAHQQQKGEGETEQKVLVLRDGWKGFSSKFKADPSLVKDYNQDQQWES